MTINDQIRDEKLKYDINREVYHQLYHQEKFINTNILLVKKQQQIIEQAKFTYSPLGKAFEKQTKTIEDQGEKQIKAIQNKAIKRYTYDIEDTPLISKHEEIFNKLADEKIEKITNLDKKSWLWWFEIEYIGKTPIVKFDKFDDAFSILNKIRDGKISLADARSDQENCKSDLGEIKRGNNKKDHKRRKTVCTILICFTNQGTRLLNFMIIIL